MRRKSDALAFTLLVLAVRKRPSVHPRKVLPSPLSFRDRLFSLINHTVIVFTGYPGGFEGILTSVNRDFVIVLGQSATISAVFIPIKMISSIVLTNPRITDQVGL